MTQDGVAALAEYARDEHMRALDLKPTPWHLAPKNTRAAWIGTVSLVLSEQKRLIAVAAEKENEQHAE